jgi:hypothetical protein
MNSNDGIGASHNFLSKSAGQSHKIENKGNPRRSNPIHPTQQDAPSPPITSALLQKHSTRPKSLDAKLQSRGNRPLLFGNWPQNPATK